ncbi:integron integrase [Solitalea lacus]|uniref:integron integrase n=1 Tax=Solitalea lacus TaxID=2911172 RepID=UPI001EDBF29C|nr:integron integrase [Solitalea lacus]UKJ09262.1 integron integrase [Solitalea lacus]
MKISLLEEVRQILKLQRKSYRTEQSYSDWIYRFIVFHEQIPPSELREKEIGLFLHFLAKERNASVATQNQALQAILFLYKHVLRIELKNASLLRTRNPQRLPEVLSRNEIGSILKQLKGEVWLMTALLYGCGLRLSECVSLRVQDIDLNRSRLTIGLDKGNKERLLSLPESIKVPLKEHVETLRLRHQRCLSNGFCGVSLPNGMEKQAMQALCDWQWFYLFPADKPSVEPVSGKITLHHRSDSFLEKSIKEAVSKTSISGRISCNVFRHSFATHLLENGYSIHTVQTLLGHSDIRTTMVYTKVANSKLLVRSPLDDLD